MKVTYSNQKETVLFSSLHPGIVFEWANRIYVKVSVDMENQYNCFSFDDNCLWYLQPTSLVVPKYESELIVK